MPSLSLENFKYNAKITAFYCLWCKIQAYAKYKTAKYCSELCRHNAYLQRKEEEEIAKRDNHVNITKKSRDYHVDENLSTTKLKSYKIVGSHNVQDHFRKINIKITLKSLKDMVEGCKLPQSSAS